MNPLSWVHNDGGRADAAFKGDAGDCVVRAIAIAEEAHGNLELFGTYKPSGNKYREIYTELAEANAKYAATHRSRVAKTIAKRGPTARNGNFKQVYHPWLLSRGWIWTPTMKIGSGTTVHLRKGELPGGVLIASLSRHMAAVVDGVVHDTYDPTREGTRPVYGYYSRA